jgi:MFS family permease
VSALHAGGFGLGATLGPILGSGLTAWIGYRMAFTVTACLMFLLSFLHLGSQFCYTRLKPESGLLDQKQGEVELDQVKTTTSLNDNIQDDENEDIL